MNLPDADVEYLVRNGIVHEVAVEGRMLCVILKDFPLPAGLSQEKADVLFRLPALYPDVPPDMWWISPALRSSGGQVIQATEVTEQHLGRSWQRWSRHLDSGSWLAGVDGIDTWIALLRAQLDTAAEC